MPIVGPKLYWFCVFRQADEVDDLPVGFSKIKDMTMLAIGAVFKIFDTYSDMALAHILYTGTYGSNCNEGSPDQIGHRLG